MVALRRGLTGSAVAVAGVAVLVLVMLPLRSHLDVATSALVLVVPVVLAVVVGGFVAGTVAVALGFLAYDFFFIPPYGTLEVGASRNWVALAVYVIVMLAVTRVVDRLQAVRLVSAQHAAAARRLFELSDMLIAEKPLPELLSTVVSTVRDAFSFSSVALLLPESADQEYPSGAPLVVGASAGEALSEDELRRALPAGGVPASLVTRVTHAPTAGRAPNPVERLLTVPLVATGRPVGALVAKGQPLRMPERELLLTYANQAALAIERARLRGQALRAELLEEVDRWRSALIGAVSHDLRTPLAAVKTAVSDLRAGVFLSDEDRDELLALVESQSDRLARLVTNLLDMTRIQTGALVPRREAVAFGELLDEALAALAGTEVPGRVLPVLEADLPLVEVDHALVSQALANLLDNAGRHAPDAGPIEVRARRRGAKLEVEVRDRGPGIPPEDRERIFLMFNRVSGAGRAGLGLAIVKAFVEAHGETVAVTDTPEGGAGFVFSLPLCRDGAAHLIERAVP